MISTQVMLLIFGTIITWSTQKPLVFRSNYKRLSGIPPSVPLGLRRSVYFYDQTVAVIDVNPAGEIQGCEIDEKHEPSEFRQILLNLSANVTLAEITFLQMFDLIYRCEVFDRMQSSISIRNHTEQIADEPETGVYDFFHGIFPGTKWCGAGNLSQNYRDLGPRRETDRCCRTHDLCPVHIKGFETRYNISNTSRYSKSHCACDIGFYQCLKQAATKTAKLIGTLYFDVAAMDCITEVSERGKSAKKFTRTGLVFGN